MPQVNIPDEIHKKVEGYAADRGYAAELAYVELVEFALRETDRDEDEDIQSGIA